MRAHWKDTLRLRQTKQKVWNQTYWNKSPDGQVVVKNQGLVQAFITALT